MTPKSPLFESSPLNSNLTPGATPLKEVSTTTLPLFLTSNLSSAKPDSCAHLAETLPPTEHLPPLQLKSVVVVSVYQQRKQQEGKKRAKNKKKEMQVEEGRWQRKKGRKMQKKQEKVIKSKNE